MAIFPLLERDLSVALRKHRPVSRRLKIAAGGVAGTMLLLFFVNVMGDSEASQELHMILFLVSLGFALQAPKLVAGVIARERQEQTLGLLFLSGLRAGEIFLGKFFSATLIAFADLLAIYPMIAVPFLAGGIAFDHFAATICWLPNFLFFLLSISLLASVLAEDDASAPPLAASIGGIICGLPLIIYFFQAQLPTGAPSHWWLRLSPVYGAFLIFKRSSNLAPDFWQGFGLTVTYSVACLVFAAWRLSRIWRYDTGGVHQSAGHRLWQKFYHGDYAWRREVGRPWLDANATVWLGLRDRKPAMLAWLMVGVFAIFWLALFGYWPSRSAVLPIFIASAIALVVLLRWLIFYTAAAGMAKGRLEGAYDLILTTPIKPGEIVSGQVEALNAQFKPVCRVAVGFQCLLAAAGLTLRNWTAPTLIVYSGTWILLIFWAHIQLSRFRHSIPAMWAGLNGVRPAHAAWKTLGVNVWAGVWFVVCFRSVWPSLARFPTGSLVEVLVILVCALLLFAFVARPKAEADTVELRLVDEFHEIIQEPIPEPTDPRFKGWDPRERFPWGGVIAEQQRQERIMRRCRSKYE